MPLTLGGVPQSQNLTLSNVPTQGMTLSNAPMGLGAAANQQPDIVQMLSKYNLGAAPGMLGGTLGGIGLQSVDAPAPMTPPAALPPANPVNTDDFIPRDVRGPMTVMDTLNQLSKMNMGQAPVGMPQPGPLPQSGPMPQLPPDTPVRPMPPQSGQIHSYDPAAQYRSFGNQLAQMIQAGQITPQQANAIKAPLFEATKLGNSFEGYKAMQAAQQNAMGMLPRQGYDPAAEYRNFGTTLGSLLQSQYNPGGFTPEQANAIKAPIFEATKLGNTNAGYEAMQKAINAAWAIPGMPPRPVESPRAAFAVQGMAGNRGG